MYLLFYGDTYYPAGGARDFAGVFASADDAIRHGAQGNDWAHIAEFKDGALRITHVYHYRTGWRNV